eukprot:s3565_g5.t1
MSHRLASPLCAESGDKDGMQSQSLQLHTAELRPQGRNASISDLSIFEDLLSTRAESRMFRKTTKSMTLVYHAFAPQESWNSHSRWGATSSSSRRGQAEAESSQRGSHYRGKGPPEGYCPCHVRVKSTKLTFVPLRLDLILVPISSLDVLGPLSFRVCFLARSERRMELVLQSLELLLELE